MTCRMSCMLGLLLSGLARAGYVDCASTYWKVRLVERLSSEAMMIANVFGKLPLGVVLEDWALYNLCSSG